MWWIRIDVYDIIAYVVVEEGNENDVPMIDNVFVKKKT